MTERERQEEMSVCLRMLWLVSLLCVERGLPDVDNIKLDNDILTVR